MGFMRQFNYNANFFFFKKKALLQNENENEALSRKKEMERPTIALVKAYNHTTVNLTKQFIRQYRLNTRDKTMIGISNTILHAKLIWKAHGMTIPGQDLDRLHPIFQSLEVST